MYGIWIGRNYEIVWFVCVCVCSILLLQLNIWWDNERSLEFSALFDVIPFHFITMIHAAWKMCGASFQLQKTKNQMKKKKYGEKQSKQATKRSVCHRKCYEFLNRFSCNGNENRNYRPREKKKTRWFKLNQTICRFHLHRTVVFLFDCARMWARFEMKRHPKPTDGCPVLERLERLVLVKLNWSILYTQHRLIFHQPFVFSCIFLTH